MQVLAVLHDSDDGDCYPEGVGSPSVSARDSSLLLVQGVLALSISCPLLCIRYWASSLGRFCTALMSPLDPPRHIFYFILFTLFILILYVVCLHPSSPPTRM